VLAAVAERLQTGSVDDYTTRTTFADVAEPWHAHLVELADAGRRSPTTIALYRWLLDRHVLPAIGALRLAS
jgi:hypothetical protein